MNGLGPRDISFLSLAWCLSSFLSQGSFMGSSWMTSYLKIGGIWFCDDSAQASVNKTVMCNGLEKFTDVIYGRPLKKFYYNCWTNVTIWTHWKLYLCSHFEFWLLSTVLSTTTTVTWSSPLSTTTGHSMRIQRPVTSTQVWFRLVTKAATPSHQWQRFSIAIYCNIIIAPTLPYHLIYSTVEFRTTCSKIVRT